MQALRSKQFLDWAAIHAAKSAAVSGGWWRGGAGLPAVPPACCCQRLQRLKARPPPARLQHLKQREALAAWAASAGGGDLSPGGTKLGPALPQ